MYRGIDYFTSEEEISGKGRGDIHDWQVKCVDEACNNGWMRELENRAQPLLTPLIRGERTMLTVRSQRIIAGWAVLKAMIGERDIPDFESWPPSALNRMMMAQLPPSRNCWIWIGHYERGTNWNTHWLHNPMLLLPRPKDQGRFGEPATEFNSSASTQVFGNLFLHVIHTPMNKLISIHRFADSVEGKLRKIWPVTPGQIRWPPDAMDDREAKYVSGALVRTVQNLSRRVIKQRGVILPPIER